MANRVRVRFAPSPTGPLHIGGIRTALFNYLFAKKNKGDFIVRIEDTDQNRYVNNAESYIENSLAWCGIIPDESPNASAEIQKKYGPYRQSERKAIYKKHVQQLIDTGCAYYAFDTPEALETHRKNHESQGKTFIYNWHNRLKLQNSLALPENEVNEMLNSGMPYVIRFKGPQDKTLTLKDIIRGEVVIDTNILDDKILFKSDGMPTYHLANIVDDHLMHITHVIRGEEWLPSLALHVLLYKAFGWEIPQFAHLPLILKPTGKGKLSKRDGDKMGFPVFPLEWKDTARNEISKGYKEEGYFNDAVVNFLAFLGWNPGTEQELFSLQELINSFELEKVHKAGARFDPEKIKWYNHQYLQQKDTAYLAELFLPYLKEKGLTPSIEYVTKVIELTKERASFVSDFWELTNFFFIPPMAYDEKAVKKQWKTNTSKLLLDIIKIVDGISNFTPENTEIIIKQYITDNNVSFGQVMPPLRLALVGTLKGPHVFDIIALLGKTETIERIKNVIRYLK